MTDIREKAEALITHIENFNYNHCDGNGTVRLDDTFQYKAFIAALRPSRSEIADHLEGNIICNTDATRQYLDYAIEELRS